MSMGTGAESGRERRIQPRANVVLGLRCRLLAPDERVSLSAQMGLPDPEIPPLQLPGTADKPADFIAVNLSIGGFGSEGELQMLSDRELVKGDDMAVELALPGEILPLVCVARVMWAFLGSDGRTMVGLMFVLMSEKHTTQLHSFVARHTNQIAA